MPTSVKASTGETFLIDDEDLHWVIRHKWQVNTYGYVFRSTSDKGRKYTLYIHRAILPTPKGFEVDHRDRNKLNNTRSNLRQCTRRQNVANVALPDNGYRGVRKSPGGGFVAKHLDRSLGLFCTAEDAARVVDAASFAANGEFAVLNLPGQKDQPKPKAYSRSKTGYRGVYPVNGRFFAICRGKYVGCFATPVEAAKAYDGKAKTVKDRNLPLNFPD